MKETLTLSNPIMVNGKERKTFAYDIEEITGVQFQKADALARATAAQMGRYSLNVVETDSSLHLQLGMQAVLAVETEVDISDLERIKGRDLMKLYRIGRNFIKESAGEEEEEESPDSREEH